MTNTTQNYPWHFQRIGGLDQVVLSNAQDIAHLAELDPKLWVALSCPASGLEFDDKTLSLLDEDKDGRIRIPDVVNAVNWLKLRLAQFDTLLNDSDELALSSVNTKTAEGVRLLATIQAVLANINQADKTTISLADLAQSKEINLNNFYNGDGIIPATSTIDEDLQVFIQDTINIMGSVKDASDLDGVNTEITQAFQQSLQAWLTWFQSINSATTALGDNTVEAWQLMRELKSKIDDYFLRTELASYAPQAQASLNVDEKYIVPTDNGLLENATLADLPLSKVDADKPLLLTSGLNPVWRTKVLRFIELVKPFVANSDELTRDEWLAIQDMLAPYAKAMEAKPTLVAANVTTPPAATIDSLGEEKVKQILTSDLFERFTVLAEKDSKTPAPAADIAEVEKLVLFHKHLYRLLMNFASFGDFFDVNRHAAFEAGKLYLDGRCCELCIPVTDIAKHSALAGYSELFLVYCDCTRKDPATGTEQKRTIVAAMTEGDSDFLLDGRNGVFIDNDGNDWDAKVVKTVTKPISIRQAILDPYKRIGRFITEQINKWASSKDDAVANASSTAVQAPPTADSSQKFDIGKSVGIFAAIGLALGALGTALASIASSLLQLTWWQFPLVFLGIFIIISGPSVILAWLKLRQRTLAPLLEASGWAINGKVKINLLLGNRLTSQATLPTNAKRSMMDPETSGKKKFWVAFSLAVIIGIAATGAYLWCNDYFAPQSGVVPPEAAVTEAAPATQETEVKTTE